MILTIITIIGLVLVYKTLVGITIHKDNNSLVKIGQLLIVSLILLPSVKISDALPYIRFDDIILLLTFFVFIRKFPINLISKILIVFFILILISVSFGVVKGAVSKINDFFDLIIVFKIIIIFTLFGSIKEESAINKIIKTVGICSVLSFTIAIMQYFNILNINENLAYLYSSTQTETLGNEDIFARRVIGTLANPNMYGIFTVIILSFNVAYYLYSRKKNIYPIFIFFLGIPALFFTNSRQSIISLALILFIIFTLSIFNKSIRRLKNNKKIIFVIIVLILSLQFMLNYSSVFSDRVTSISKATSVGSVTSRLLIKWPYYISKIPENPFFGIGTPKSEKLNIFGSADSELILMVFSYGLIATIIYYLAFFVILLKAIQNIKFSNIEPIERIVSIFSIGFFIVLLEINIFSGTFWDMQLSMLVWGLAGLNYSIYKKYRQLQINTI